ncbi:zinc-ribbon domain-containing protein [Mycobacterium asiaticum]|uniref:Treble clef zinc finger domain-containing protein n=1 Tax=Mycobacterium asiaticum TaxID=1790 RepID=A0A1A3N3Q1_MYCAS|nr:hypothetical protein A5636_24645 [Mycobacterium asiaticum]
MQNAFVPSATPVPGQSFADYYPEVAAQWHPTRNGDLKPTHVKAGSNKRVWWQCVEGHEWSVRPADRRRGEQCPECAERQRHVAKATPKPGRSLGDLFPEVAKEWHPTKNLTVTAFDVNPGSKQRRWWRCADCGHEWQTDPDHRTRGGRRCSKCAYRSISVSKAVPKPGESLAEKAPALAAEWHPDKNGALTPFDVRPRGRASVWWRCKFGHEWKAMVAPRAVGIGCPKCSIIGTSERQTRLECELAAAGLPVVQDHPPIPVEGRRPVRADIVMPSLHCIVEYDGSYYHAKKVRADRAQSAALEAAGWLVVRIREQPLPSIGGLEVVVTPTESIKSVAVKTLQLLARAGYSARHLARYVEDKGLWGTDAAATALYKHRAVSLATENPDLAAEFHPTKNADITAGQVHPGSNTTFWWKCGACGHEWQQKVSIRARGHGCPPCGVERRVRLRALPTPGNSFADLFPEVAKQWHPTRNDLGPDEVAAASGKVVWWRCANGHEWQAKVVVRRVHGRCRQCPPSEGGSLRRRRVGRGPATS